MLAMPGAYKNFSDLEDNLTYAELIMLLETHQQNRRANQVFDAGLVGVDLLKQEHEAKVKEVKRRAQEKIYGEKNFADMEWAELGFTVETI